LATRLSRLSVPFVVDHMGHFPTEVDPSEWTTWAGT
jgi:hypothetical protein